MSKFKETLLRSYAFNLKYAEKLVADIPQDKMTHSDVKGLENHAAFTLGHLVSAAALTVKYLGGAYSMPDGWDDLFRRKGPGDPRMPSEEVEKYPSKKELLNELKNLHQQVEELIKELDVSRLDEPAEWRLNSYMPTMADLLYFICINHENMHLGQLAGWRRSLGFDSALAKL